MCCWVFSQTCVVLCVRAFAWQARTLKKKSRTKCIVVVCCVVFLLLAGGAATFVLLYNDGEFFVKLKALVGVK